MPYTAPPSTKRLAHPLSFAATVLLLLAVACVADGASEDAQGSRTFIESARAVSGDSLEVFMPGRTAVAIMGIRAPMADAGCRERARAALAVLIDNGVTLVEPAGAPVDSSGRRIFYAFAPDGTDIGLALIKEGMVAAEDVQHRYRDAYLEAHQQAASKRAGCA